ncbi:hypothetical protein AOL_s00097g315 [Orbilia oligospora ATCC 24927]|uniref:Uncharacterized protein n=1 Tax=Arthrobotrys oligospora (strain ATCC 24927 / CBS 115.81 / DSM 1491) TaxID=756982 RepID=G1XIY8_ARTOA|nr:hypothetical protein AOL_s00097g315 [Orbilia oligospora ATCC 24927]EGX46889.1 hypothetical protein AOL_s00097g315 [Orbilia oligospora ATCC 24927]
MVSRKRRRAGLKARETYLRRLAATSLPGFGPRLWNTGHPGDMNKALWKKINAEIIAPKSRSKELSRELSRTRNEELRLTRERFKHFYDLAKTKDLQEQKVIKRGKVEVESEKLRSIRSKAAEEISDHNEDSSHVDPDETESEHEPEHTQPDEDPDKTESEVDPDETESEADPDEPEPETDCSETESEEE